MLLHNGTQGKEVAQWQSFLIQQRLLDGTADGIFGSQTKAATIQFQSQQGLQTDGVVGPGTLAAAEKLGATITTSTSGNTAFPPENSLNAVFDISHHNGTNLDFTSAKQAGMAAVFQKATQGSTFVDPTYESHRQAAQAAGFLWGAYHFADDSDPIAQADHFLSVAQTGHSTVLVLDFESNKDNTMSLDQAVQFVQRIKEKTGKYPGLYGGSLLKSLTASQANPTLSSCWLWLAEYGSTARLPKGWTAWTFWQYTDGSLGPAHETIPGIGKCDRELFNGDENALQTFWSNSAV
ncbi:MAG: GH25 family lysozyme [Bacteroidota bacterium]